MSKSIGLQNIGVENIGVDNIGVETYGCQLKVSKSIGVQNIGVKNIGFENIGVKNMGVQKTCQKHRNNTGGREAGGRSRESIVTRNIFCVLSTAKTPPFRVRTH